MKKSRKILSIILIAVFVLACFSVKVNAASVKVTDANFKEAMEGIKKVLLLDSICNVNITNKGNNMYKIYIAEENGSDIYDYDVKYEISDEYLTISTETIVDGGVSEDRNEVLGNMDKVLEKSVLFGNIAGVPQIALFWLNNVDNIEYVSFVANNEVCNVRLTEKIKKLGECFRDFPGEEEDISKLVENLYNIFVTSMPIEYNEKELRDIECGEFDIPCNDLNNYVFSMEAKDKIENSFKIVSTIKYDLKNGDYSSNAIWKPFEEWMDKDYAEDVINPYGENYVPYPGNGENPGDDDNPGDKPDVIYTSEAVEIGNNANISLKIVTNAPAKVAVLKKVPEPSSFKDFSTLKTFMQGKLAEKNSVYDVNNVLSAFECKITDTTSSNTTLEFDIDPAYNGKRVIFGYVTEETEEGKEEDSYKSIEGIITAGTIRFSVNSIRSGMLMLIPDSNGNVLNPGDGNGGITNPGNGSDKNDGEGSGKDNEQDKKKDETLPKTGLESSRVTSYLTTLAVVCGAWLVSMLFVSRVAKKHRAKK